MILMLRSHVSKLVSIGLVSWLAFNNSSRLRSPIHGGANASRQAPLDTSAADGRIE